MSPEQALGNDTDARTDIFSLGSILCTLLLGRHYFAADSIPDILGRIIRDDPPVLSQRVHGVPTGLDDVVRRAMAKVPADRYDNAGLLADDLEDILASQPRGTRACGRARPWARHPRRLSRRARRPARAHRRPRAAADGDGQAMEELHSLVADAPVHPPTDTLPPRPEPATVAAARCAAAGHGAAGRSCS